MRPSLADAEVLGRLIALDRDWGGRGHLTLDDEFEESDLNKASAQSEAIDKKELETRKFAPGALSARPTIRLGDRLRRALAGAGGVPSAAMHNERVLYAEAATQAINTAGAMSFISIFLVRLDAPTWLVGLYTSLPALVIMLVVLPTGSFVQRQRSLISTACWGRMLFRSIIALFGLLPFLPPTIAPFVLVAARALISVPSSVFMVAFTTVLGQATTAERRPRMLSMRMAISGLFATPLGLLAGYWLDYASYPLNYQILFLSAFVAGVVSVFVLSRLTLGATPQRHQGRKERAGLREMIALVKGTPAFRSYAVVAFFFRLSISMPMALYPIYRVRTLGCSDSWIGVLLTAQRFVGVLSYFALVRLLTRRKYRRWLWVSCVGVGLYPFTMALARTPAMLLVPAVVGGIFGSGMNIFLTNVLFEVSPEDQRPTFVAANTFLASLAGFVAPMMGTALADATTIGFALIVAGALRTLTGLAFKRVSPSAQE